MSVLSDIMRGAASRSGAAVGRLLQQDQARTMRQQELADAETFRQQKLADAETLRKQQIKLALAKMGLDPSSGTPYEDISREIQRQNEQPTTVYGAVPSGYERTDGQLSQTPGAPAAPLPQPIFSEDKTHTLTPDLSTDDPNDYIATPISGLPEPEITIESINATTGLTKLSDGTFIRTSDEHQDIIDEAASRRDAAREARQENEWNRREQGRVLARDRERYDKAISTAQHVIEQVATKKYDGAWAMQQIGMATSQLEPSLSQAIVDQVKLATDGNELSIAGNYMESDQKRLNNDRRILIGHMKAIINLADDPDVVAGMGNLSNAWVKMDEYLGGTFMNEKTRRFMQSLRRLRDDHQRAQTGAAMSLSEESFYNSLSGFEFTEAFIIQERMEQGINHSQRAMDEAWRQAIYTQYAGRRDAYNKAVKQYNSFEGRSALEEKDEGSVADADEINDARILSDIGENR